MRLMRRAILFLGLVALVAAASSSGASKLPFKAKLTAAGHAPKAKSTWRYHVRVTDLKGHPISARITSQIVDPLGTAHLARGETNPGIAAALHLSERTVAHHVSAVLQKLGAPTRTAAVEQARSRGLLAQDGPVPGPN